MKRPCPVTGQVGAVHLRTTRPGRKKWTSGTESEPFPVWKFAEGPNLSVTVAVRALPPLVIGWQLRRWRLLATTEGLAFGRLLSGSRRIFGSRVCRRLLFSPHDHVTTRYFDQMLPTFASVPSPKYTANTIRRKCSSFPLEFVMKSANFVG
jgi:hypothetical protein